MFSLGIKCGVLFLCTLFVLSACTSIFTQTDDDLSAPSTAATSMQTVPERGGDLFIAVPEGLTSYDPLESGSEDLTNFYSLIYESPFTYDETGRLQNVLIDSWTVSEDERTYTFRFRDDVFFSDGTQMTSQDVLESAQRARGAGDSGEAEAAEGDGTAAGQSEGTSPSSAEQVESVTADGPETLVVTLSEPGNAALHFMTFPVTKRNFQPAELPLGTGPYMVTGSDQEGQLTLEVNPYWWSEQEPYIERIVAKPVSAQSAKIEMQQTSLVDVITTEALNAGNYNISGKSQAVDYMTNYFDCLVPNLDRGPTRNLQVRQAISDAIDRRVLLSTVLLNHGVPTVLPVPPDSFLVDARFRSNQQDKQRALELLEEEGYCTEEGGPGEILRLNLIVPDTLENSYRKEAVRSIRKQLAEVCIEVTVEELPPAEYTDRLEKGDFDLAYCTYYLSDAPALSFLVGTGGAGNYNGYSSRAVDDALDAYDAAVTEEEMVAAYAGIQELLNQDLPVIGLYFLMNSVIYDEGIGGLSGIRENRLFSGISGWYTASRSVPAATGGASPGPAASPARQTQPDSVSPSDPSATRSAGPDE